MPWPKLKDGLEDLEPGDLAAVDVRITEDVFNVLGVNNSVRSRKSYGGTAPENVRTQIVTLRGSVFCHDRALDNDLYLTLTLDVGLSLWKETL